MSFWGSMGRNSPLVFILTHLKTLNAAYLEQVGQINAVHQPAAALFSNSSRMWPLFQILQKNLGLILQGLRVFWCLWLLDKKSLLFFYFVLQMQTLSAASALVAGLFSAQSPCKSHSHFLFCSLLTIDNNAIFQNQNSTGT